MPTHTKSVHEKKCDFHSYFIFGISVWCGWEVRLLFIRAPIQSDSFKVKKKYRNKRIMSNCHTRYRKCIHTLCLIVNFSEFMLLWFAFAAWFIYVVGHGLYTDNQILTTNYSLRKIADRRLNKRRRRRQWQGKHEHKHTLATFVWENQGCTGERWRIFYTYYNAFAWSAFWPMGGQKDIAIKRKYPSFDAVREMFTNNCLFMEYIYFTQLRDVLFDGSVYRIGFPCVFLAKCASGTEFRVKL